MLPRRIAGRYAEALFALSQEKKTTSEWEAELRAIGQVIDTSPELRDVLTHPEIPLAQKNRIVEKAFQGKIAPEVMAVLLMLIKRGHDPAMSLLAEIYHELWDQARRILPVNVQSAVPLTTAQTTALTQTLQRKTGATVQLQTQVNPELIAGLVVTMGDRVVDASARATLEGLRAAMTSI